MNGKGLAAAAVALVAAVALINSRRAHDAVRPAPRPNGSTSTAAPTPQATAVSASCGARDPGVTREVDLQFISPGHPNLRVTAIRCPDVAGHRAPSIVRVVDLDDDHRIVATLVRPEQNVHVASVEVTGDMVTVTAALAGPTPKAGQPAPDWPGSVFVWRFVTEDGLSYGQLDPVRIALACRPPDVALSAELPTVGTPLPGGRVGQPAGDAAIRLTNRSGAPCALEGYPRVTGRTAAETPVIGTPELHGVSSGVFDFGAPRVIVLGPGEQATSRVESARFTPPTGYPTCPTLGTVDVALPDGASVGRLALPMRACGLDVHPLVAGTTGRSG